MSDGLQKVTGEEPVICLFKMGAGRWESPIAREIARSHYWYQGLQHLHQMGGLAPVNLDINSESDHLAPF